MVAVDKAGGKVEPVVDMAEGWDKAAGKQVSDSIDENHQIIYQKYLPDSDEQLHSLLFEPRNKTRFLARHNIIQQMKAH